MALLPSVRHKPTNWKNVLPPVAELLTDSNSTIWYTDLDGNQVSLDFRELAAADPHPIPMPVDREGYGTVESSPRFWGTGHTDWINVQSAIDRYMPSRPVEGEKLRLFDFGCASGRFLRHVQTFGGDTTDVWGCDFAPENLNWVKQYLPSDIKMLLNNANPHLPFSDGYFDVVTAFSVFTHIDMFEDAWLLELRRITRPGGLLYLTTQNDAAWPLINERPASMEHMQRANLIEGNLPVSEELFANEMPESRIVFRMSSEENYNCNVWVTNQYIHDQWSRYFDVHHIANNAHTSFQSPVIMSPKGTAMVDGFAATPSIVSRPKPR